jgi:hypothetical protein
MIVILLDRIAGGLRAHDYRVLDFDSSGPCLLRHRATPD